MPNRAEPKRQASVAGLWLVLLVGCVQLGGCASERTTGADPAPQSSVSASIGALDVSLRIVGDGAQVLADEAQLTRDFSSLLLGQAPWMSTPQAFVVDQQLRIDVVASEHHAGTIIVDCLWEGRLGAVHDLPSIRVEVPFLHPEAGYASDPARAIGSDLDQVADAVSAAVSIVLGDDAQVVAALSEPRPGVIETAIRESARRELDAAVPALTALVASPHDDVALAAIGALSQMGAESAVTAIVARCPMDHPLFILAAAPAIARFESTEAIGFLQTLASGHPDEDVRAQATALLAAP